jgi:hypothetical protein
MKVVFDKKPATAYSKPIQTTRFHSQLIVVAGDVDNLKGGNL